MSEPSCDDVQFEDSEVKKVEAGEGGWTFELATGWSFYAAREHGVEPHVGDVARLWGKGIGYPVRGLAINGVVAYYRTEAEQEQKHADKVAESQSKKREEFEAAREDHDRRIAALPAPFRERFTRFLSHNPDFRWEFESYELFCCEEAVKLARHAEVTHGRASTPEEWLRAFAKADHDTQRKLAPTMKLDEHSGNTFGCTVQLAHCYTTDYTLVPWMHGALANLVGCEEYGCPPRPAPPPGEGQTT